MLYINEQNLNVDSILDRNSEHIKYDKNSDTFYFTKQGLIEIFGYIQQDTVFLDQLRFRNSELNLFLNKRSISYDHIKSYLHIDRIPLKVFIKIAKYLERNGNIIAEEILDSWAEDTLKSKLKEAIGEIDLLNYDYGTNADIFIENNTRVYPKKQDSLWLEVEGFEEGYEDIFEVPYRKNPMTRMKVIGELNKKISPIAGSLQQERNTLIEEGNYFKGRHNSHVEYLTPILRSLTKECIQSVVLIYLQASNKAYKRVIDKRINLADKPEGWFKKLKQRYSREMINKKLKNVETRIREIIIHQLEYLESGETK